MTVLKLILKIMIAPVILLLTPAIWINTGLVYVSGLVFGLLSTVIALLVVVVLVTYSPQNGLIPLVITFLISPFGAAEAGLLATWKGTEFSVLTTKYNLRMNIKIIDDISNSSMKSGCFKIEIL